MAVATKVDLEWDEQRKIWVDKNGAAWRPQVALNVRSRANLQEIHGQAQSLAKVARGADWRKAYARLASAADRCDAVIARSEAKGEFKTWRMQNNLA